MLAGWTTKGGRSLQGDSETCESEKFPINTTAAACLHLVDRIIRGGENISPSAIESIMGRNPTLNALVPQVVGVRDEIAGEVPVCVIKGSATPEIRELIQSEIVQHMGTLYVPEDVIPIKELGLEDYPRTTSGKIQKAKLAALVKKHLSRSEEALDSTTGNDANLTEELRLIWAKAVGLEPSRIRLDAPIGEFADSITVMRVRDRIKRTTGKALSLSAMAEAGTIENQIKLLQSMGAGRANGTQEVQVKRPTRQGTPEVEDMAHLIEDPELLGPTKDVVIETISKLGLGWEDVEDVIPAYDFGTIMSQTKLYDSWNFNFSIHPSRKIDKEVSSETSESHFPYMGRLVLTSLSSISAVPLKPLLSTTVSSHPSSSGTRISSNRMTLSTWSSSKAQNSLI